MQFAKIVILVSFSRENWIYRFDSYKSMYFTYLWSWIFKIGVFAI
jgi:hypothetical protein